MTFINSLIKKENISQISSNVTLRLSHEEDMVLSLACEKTGYSRNELIYMLLKTYVFEDKKTVELLDNYENSISKVDVYPNYHVINTNISNDKDDDEFMVSNGYAAAFEDGYKEKICNIKEGDMVFLYRSKEGIIAQGVASGEVLKTHHYDKENKTYYQKLSDFKLYEKALKPSKIKRILGRNVVFMPTWFSLSDGYKLLKYNSENN